MVEEARPILLVLLAGSGLLLPSVLVNVNTLLFTRPDRCRREIAVRFVGSHAWIYER
jgi:hypothetical protein